MGSYCPFLERLVLFKMPTLKFSWLKRRRTFLPNVALLPLTTTNALANECLLALLGGQYFHLCGLRTRTCQDSVEQSLSAPYSRSGRYENQEVTTQPLQLFSGTEE
jgi:hypothetical protein